MIADLDQTIEKLITTEFPIKNGEIDIAFDQPKREWSARLARPTINFFLFDIRENNVLRQHQWEKMAQLPGNGGPPNIQQKRTPFRIDCHYIITSWAANPKDEHRLLSRTLLTLFRYPILPESTLMGDIKGQPFKIQAKLVTHDHLTNPAELWGAMDNEIRPSMSYLVTLAADPWAEVTGPAVTSYTLTTGIAENLPGNRIDGETAVTSHHIAGTITTENDPQAGITVAIKNSGFITTTNNKGQYMLGSLPEGEHTLVAWTATGKPIEKSITVPGTGYDIEL
jgi:hypothetical protein